MARVLALTVVLLIFLAGSHPGKAELHYQGNMEGWCKPAHPISYTVLKWEQPGQFIWRLECSNGRTFRLQSNLHPQTSDLQYSFYNWAPWSIVAFLLPFVAFVAIAALGSRFHAALIALHGLFLGYALYGALYLYSSVTGDPGDAWFAMAAILYFNPLVSVGVTAVFVAANGGAFWEGCRTIFGMPLTVDSPAISAADMSIALMPSVYEIDDPARTAEFYRQETEKLLAAKSHLQAQTKRARALLVAERAKAERNNPA